MLPILASVHDYVPDWLKPITPPEDASWPVFILYWVGVIGGMSAIAMGIVAVIVVRMPENYFTDDKHEDTLKKHHSAFRWVGIIFKNIVGVFLVVFGVIASGPGVPGPGFLTIFIGLVMVDFIPKKKEMMKWLLGWKFVRDPLQAVRKYFSKPPLDLGDSGKKSDNKQDKPH